MVGCTDGCMGGYINEGMSGCIDGRMNEWVDAHMDVWVNIWMYECMVWMYEICHPDSGPTSLQMWAQIRRSQS